MTVISSLTFKNNRANLTIKCCNNVKQLSMYCFKSKENNMNRDLNHVPFSPFEQVLKKAVTEYSTGKMTREGIISYAMQNLDSQSISVFQRLIDNQPLESEMDDSATHGSYIYMDTQPRYFPAIMHSHSFFEAIFVYSGKCINVFPNSLFELKEGDFFILPPGMEHSLSVHDDDSIVINILIQKKTFHNAFAGLISDHDVFSEFFNNALFGGNSTTTIYVNCDKAINGHINLMYRNIDLSRPELSSRILNLHFQVLISYIIRDCMDKIHIYETKTLENPLLPLMKYLKANSAVATRFSTAQRFGYSSDYLYRLIKQHTGKSFVELITEIRMQKASDLLINSKMNIDMIAENCGYLGKSNFYTAFKKEFGITPKQYRENHL